MVKSRENAKKPVFPAYGRKKFFFENRAPSLFGDCRFAPLCQKLEKNNEPIREKLVTDERTNGRTNIG